MGTTLFAVNVLSAPLQQLARWLVRSVAGVPGRGPAAAAVVRPPGEPATGRRQVTGPSSRPVALRVVRVLDGPHPAGRAGRMVISGRMADVCAELERMAALEAAAG